MNQQDQQIKLNNKNILMKKSYIKPTTEIIRGKGENLMVQISSTTTPEESEAKGFDGWNDSDNDDEKVSRISTNAWEAWDNE